jgi:hypothetical protein
MKKRQGVFFGFAVLLIAAIFTVAGCDNGDGDDIWLADLSNPFIGKWESKIPSMGNAVMVSEYKTDGTFTALFPDLPVNQGGGVTYDGGYLVSGNVFVSYLEVDGVAGYTFKVVDNDTIDVTEIEAVNADGSFKLGNTAPFTRVAGSSVNTEDKPFVLKHPYLGKWNFTGDYPGEIYGMQNVDTVHIVTNYEAKANGMLAFDFTVSNTSTDEVLMSDTDESPYFIFNNVLVVYEVGEGFETGTIIPGDDSDTIYLAEEGEEFPVPLTRIP